MFRTLRMTIGRTLIHLMLRLSCVRAIAKDISLDHMRDRKESAAAYRRSCLKGVELNNLPRDGFEFPISLQP
jgi:hypothetical protein